MKCRNCGATYPDGTAYCEICGNPLSAEPVQQEKKKVNLGGFGPKNLLLILVGVAVLVMFLGHVSLVNTSVENIRPISMLMEMSGEEDAFRDAKDEIDELADKIEDQFELREDEIEEELGKKGIKLSEKLLKSLEKCADKLSINNFKNLTKAYTNLAEVADGEFDDLEDDIEEIQEIQKGLGVIATGLLIASLLSLLFTVIRGLVRKSGLVIAGLVFSTLFCLIFYNWLFIIANIAVHVVMIKLIKNDQ